MCTIAVVDMNPGSIFTHCLPNTQLITRVHKVQVVRLVRKVTLVHRDSRAHLALRDKWELMVTLYVYSKIILYLYLSSKSKFSIWSYLPIIVILDDMIDHMAPIS